MFVNLCREDFNLGHIAFDVSHLDILLILLMVERIDFGVRGVCDGDLSTDVGSIVRIFNDRRVDFVHGDDTTRDPSRLLILLVLWCGPRCEFLLSAVRVLGDSLSLFTFISLPTIMSDLHRSVLPHCNPHADMIARR